MSDFKAPWEYDETLHTIFDSGGTAVTFLPNLHDPARARLLLKAPELLAVLQAMYVFGDALAKALPALSNESCMIEARALLAEIEGDGT
jgi:hypothetical protein